MKVAAQGEIRVRFRSPEEARAALASIEPENDGFVQARAEGEFLVATASAGSPGALLHTLDDLLACLTAAEKSFRAARPDS